MILKAGRVLLLLRRYGYDVRELASDPAGRNDAARAIHKGLPRLARKRVSEESVLKAVEAACGRAGVSRVQREET